MLYNLTYKGMKRETKEDIQVWTAVGMLIAGVTMSFIGFFGNYPRFGIVVFRTVFGICRVNIRRVYLREWTCSERSKGFYE